MDTSGYQSDQSPSMDALQSENRTLKRKLALAEANLMRIQRISVAQDRVESILNDSFKKELQFFQLVLDNTTNILLLLDIDGRFAYASQAFLIEADIANFGLINGIHYKDVLRPLISEESLTRFFDAVERAVIQKDTASIEEEIDFNFKGIPRTFSILVTPMTDEDSKRTGIMALFNDITEINNALEEAKRANLAKSDFLANMSHEIRTPLNAILGMAAIAQNNTDIERIQYCLNNINDYSTHLLGVINDILDMSKIETNHFELSFAEFVFEKMLLRVVDMMRLKIEEKNIAFSLYCDPAIPHTILSDEQRVAQVIMNILSNAVKFTPEGGSVILRAEIEDNIGDDYILRLSVQDSGIGISEEQKPRLFQVFSQADSSISRKFGGTGLGLVITKNIVNLLGGDIWFDSKEGEGTTFTFNIKTQSCFPNPATKPGRGDNSGNTDDSEGGTFNEFVGKTLLLVDDVEINREIIIALLESTGINIVCAGNGAEAVEIFTANPELDLILMDVQMPEMDGYEATRQIRSSAGDANRQIPIVAMTANVFREDVERCLAAGMNDHIGKPIDSEEIIAKIKQWTRKIPK